MSPRLMNRHGVRGLLARAQGASAGEPVDIITRQAERESHVASRRRRRVSI